MYCKKVEIDGFCFGIGRVGLDLCYHGSSEMNILLSLKDEKTIKALIDGDTSFLEALKKGLFFSDEVDCIRTFDDNFELYFTQGYSWERAIDMRSFRELEEYKRKAGIVLQSDYSSEASKMTAQKFLNALNGDIPEYIPSEQEIIYKKQEKFRNSRAKWLKLLIERDGYKCNKCLAEVDLCVKHIVSLSKGGETELENLKLACRKCINKK